MDAKIKARRKLVTKHRRRWRRVGVALTMAMIVLAGGAAGAYFGPWFRVSKIEVTGAGVLDTTVTKSLSPVRGRHAFRVDLGTLVGVLRESPNVAAEVELLGMNHPVGGVIKVRAVALPLVGTGVAGLAVAPDGRIVAASAQTTVTVCTAILSSLSEPCDTAPRLGSQISTAMSWVIDSLSKAKIRAAVSMVRGVGVMVAIPGGATCELGSGTAAVSKVRVCESLGTAGETVVEDAVDAPAVTVG